MTRLVRVLRDKAWFELVDPATELRHENIRGDAAANFCSEDCRLSFFKADQGVPIERIAAAIAASRNGLDDVDYCLVHQADVERIGCQVDSSVTGSTFFADVNTLHVDVCGVNLPRLAELSFVAVSSGDSGRIRSKAVRALLKTAIENGQLDVDKLRPGLKKSVE